VFWPALATLGRQAFEEKDCAAKCDDLKWKYAINSLSSAEEWTYWIF
jgi:hypothetical protein